MVTGTQKDHRHEAHIHTQSRPSRSTMNSLCSNLQFYHQMVWNGQVNVWLLGVMTHLLPSRKRWDGIQCRGTVTENNPTTLDCARVLSESRGNQNTEVGEPPHIKTKQSRGQKCTAGASRGRHIHVAHTTNQWKWVTTVVYRGTDSRIKNCQWGFEECDFSNKHTVHVNEAIEKECMFTWTIVHGQNDRKQQEWEENGGKSVLICAVLTQTARRYLFMWARCRRAELISP